MRCLITVFIICYTNGVIAALPDIVLCDGGYYNGSECMPYVQDGCESGYVKQQVVGSGVSFGVCGGKSVQAQGVYAYKTTKAVLCDDGYYSGGECVPYVQDGCESGYVKQQIVGSGVSFGVCGGKSVQAQGVYAYKTTKAVLCDDGYYSGSECVAYMENSELCPSGYLYVPGNMSYRAVLDGAECPSGTRVLGAYDGSAVDEKQITIWSYPYTGVPDNMIALRMCDAGYEMNYLGNCVALCGTPEMRYLRSDMGVTVPVYSKKVTSPSLGMRIGKNNKCYVNMLPESQTGAINIRYNDAMYHVVN